MLFSIAFRTAFGWLLFVLTYLGLFPSFKYAWCFPVCRLRVTSSKFLIFLFASIVIFSPCWLNVLHVTSLQLSVSFGVKCDIARPSSLHSPRDSLSVVSLFNSDNK